MPLADEIAAAASGASRANAGAFYGSAEGLSFGAGIIFGAVTFPIFNAEAGRYQARIGPVLVLTHECDIDQTNDREFNTEVLLAPLILIDAFAAKFDEKDRAQGIELAKSIAAGLVFRMMFLPPYLGQIERGAFLYFNGITSTHLSQLNAVEARPLCALSEYALGLVDRSLQNHLFRPKAERLPVLR
jgi:hypothetical protein